MWLGQLSRPRRAVSGTCSLRVLRRAEYGIQLGTDIGEAPHNVALVFLGYVGVKMTRLHDLVGAVRREMGR